VTSRLRIDMFGRRQAWSGRRRSVRARGRPLRIQRIWLDAEPNPHVRGLHLTRFRDLAKPPERVIQAEIVAKPAPSFARRQGGPALAL